MKRPSIKDSQIRPENQQDQQERPPAEVRKGNERSSVKRKRNDDALLQRVTRPKLSVNKATGRDPISTSDNKKKAKNSPASISNVPLPVGTGTSAPSLASRKTYGKQKPDASLPVQQAALQTSSDITNQAVPSVSKATLPVTKAAKSRKTIGKPKSVTKASAQAVSSSSKSPIIKMEARGPRKRPGACKTCRSRHQACDRALPACGRCAKSGTACEYPAVAGSAAPSVPVPAVSPRTQAHLSKTRSANEDDHKQDVRERSKTVSPEPPRHDSSAKYPGASSSAKAPVASAPTAASFRKPRSKNSQQTRCASPRK